MRTPFPTIRSNMSQSPGPAELMPSVSAKDGRWGGGLVTHPHRVGGAVPGRTGPAEVAPTLTHPRAVTLDPEGPLTFAQSR